MGSVAIGFLEESQKETRHVMRPVVSIGGRQVDKAPRRKELPNDLCLLVWGA
jgi:hypothetical protein